jgi:hypothetical protein
MIGLMLCAVTLFVMVVGAVVVNDHLSGPLPIRRQFAGDAAARGGTLNFPAAKRPRRGGVEFAGGVLEDEAASVTYRSSLDSQRPHATLAAFERSHSR